MNEKNEYISSIYIIYNQLNSSKFVNKTWILKLTWIRKYTNSIPSLVWSIPNRLK